MGCDRACALGRKVSVVLAAVAPIAFASVDGSHMAALPISPGPRGGTDVGTSRHRTAAHLHRLVRAERGRPLWMSSITAPWRSTKPNKIEVGYFAFFSEERPWGNNWLTWSVVPALAVDLVYSRALLGRARSAARALRGRDVEGVGVIYDRSPNGSLRTRSRHSG